MATCNRGGIFRGLLILGAGILGGYLNKEAELIAQNTGGTNIKSTFTCPLERFWRGERLLRAELVLGS